MAIKAVGGFWSPSAALFDIQNVVVALCTDAVNACFADLRRGEIVTHGVDLGVYNMRHRITNLTFFLIVQGVNAHMDALWS